LFYDVLKIFYRLEIWPNYNIYVGVIPILSNPFRDVGLSLNSNFLRYCYFFSVVPLALLLPLVLFVWYVVQYQFDNKLLLLYRKTARSYKELEARKDRLSQIEKIYMDMAMKKELQVLIFCIAYCVPFCNS